MSTLFVVSTPIGNLEDISPRALQTLRDVDTILAEDTRHVRILLSHYQIHTPVISYHQHSDDTKLQQILSMLQAHSLALVSDAGTPGISDPGDRLIAAAIAQGTRVSPVPGASAVVLALIASGFDLSRYVFLGFLPRKAGAQNRALQEQLPKHCPIVVYESSERIVKTLQNLETTIGKFELCVGREITKKFEEFVRGSYNNVLERLQAKKPRGEFTLIINANPHAR